jgi:hypothetical protein
MTHATLLADECEFTSMAFSTSEKNPGILPHTAYDEARQMPLGELCCTKLGFFARSGCWMLSLRAHARASSRLRLSSVGIEG